MIYFESFYGDGLNVDTFSGENSNCSYKDILILIKITDNLTWFNLMLERSPHHLTKICNNFFLSQKICNNFIIVSFSFNNFCY